MKPSEAAIMTVTETGYKRVGSDNEMPLPSIAGDKGFAGSGAIALSSKDNQNIVIIGFGAFVTP